MTKNLFGFIGGIATLWLVGFGSTAVDADVKFGTGENSGKGGFPNGSVTIGVNDNSSGRVSRDSASPNRVPSYGAFTPSQGPGSTTRPTSGNSQTQTLPAPPQYTGYPPAYSESKQWKKFPGNSYQPANNPVLAHYPSQGAMPSTTVSPSQAVNSYPSYSFVGESSVPNVPSYYPGSGSEIYVYPFQTSGALPNRTQSFSMSMSSASSSYTTSTGYAAASSYATASGYANATGYATAFAGSYGGLNAGGQPVPPTQFGTSSSNESNSANGMGTIHYSRRPSGMSIHLYTLH